MCFSVYLSKNVSWLNILIIIYLSILLNFMGRKKYFLSQCTMLWAHIFSWGKLNNIYNQLSWLSRLHCENKLTTNIFKSKKQKCTSQVHPATCWYTVTVEHPKMAIIAGAHAFSTWCQDMVPHHTPAETKKQQQIISLESVCVCTYVVCVWVCVS